MKEYRSILVRCTNWVGDAILTTPVYRALKKNHPDAHLTVVARPWVAGVLEGNRFIDEVVVEEGRGLMATRRLARRLAAARSYDLGLALPNSFAAALLLRMAGARERIGYAVQLRSALLTRAMRVPRWLLHQHQVNYYLWLLRDVCGDFSGVRRLELAVSAENEREADEVLASFGVRRGEAFTAVAPGAAFGTAKRWPPGRYRALVEALVERDGRPVVLVGSAKEGELSETLAADLFARNFAASRSLHNACGKLSIKGTAALLARCAHFVTNDSGAMHIAAALDMPMTVLHGPTDMHTTPPLSARATIVSDFTECSPCLLRECPIDHRCMEKLSPARVLGEVGSAAPGSPPRPGVGSLWN